MACRTRAEHARVARWRRLAVGWLSVAIVHFLEIPSNECMQRITMQITASPAFALSMKRISYPVATVLSCGNAAFMEKRRRRPIPGLRQ